MAISVPRRTVSAHDVALREIRDLILTGEYQPGAPIRQETVAARLGLSVIPVREALKSLQGEGQVVFVPRRGFFVSEYSRDDLLEICSIRAALEGMAIRRGVPLLTPAVLAEMREAEARMREADAAADVIAFLDADRRFHFSLLGPGCGPQMYGVLTSLWDRSDHYRAKVLSESATRHSNHHEHEAIVSAAEAGDAERVIELLDAHRLGALKGLDHGAETREAG
ncbi:GntR family transcriptional regulator [Streptomyces sp. J2-1]|uniref:GntR family transcriptional regulator n=1 Tax=Streptomyces corallincola TaxID=2851888 RepID=UPI001C388B25|nr:GntR family transcriptional regulator [Streptomyces corallincola]MBV2355438.1 GntR family transcriptional regulator [Streptomyces corallincola]